MNYNFDNESQLNIPASEYRPFKRCEYCNSVYLTDNLCESCGRSVRFDLLGPPFGYKSYFGIKERYALKLPILVKKFPLLEDITSPQACSLVRQLKKRLGDISSLISDHEEQKRLEIEAGFIIDELLIFGVTPFIIENYLNDVKVLKNQLEISRLTNHAKKSPLTEILNYRVAGFLRVHFLLQLVILLTSLIVIINWQFGK
jgi:hypothetical protein